jgi:hypothetical protein
LKLSEEFSDLSLKYGNACQGCVEFTTQPSTLRALRAWKRSVRCHEREDYLKADGSQVVGRPGKQN